MNQETKAAIRSRTLAHDVRSGRTAEITYTSMDGHHVWLCPVGGGPEWYAPREFVQLINDTPERTRDR